MTSYCFPIFLARQIHRAPSPLNMNICKLQLIYFNSDSTVKNHRNQPTKYRPQIDRDPLLVNNINKLCSL